MYVYVYVHICVHICMDIYIRIDGYIFVYGEMVDFVNPTR